MDRAARLFGAATHLLEERNLQLEPSNTKLFAPLEATARARLWPEAWAAAWEAGQAMTLDEAIAYALAEDTGIDQDQARV
jgi:hypothetical protein